VNKEEPIAVRALEATALLELQDGQMLPQRGTIARSIRTGCWYTRIVEQRLWSVDGLLR
jgi:hypothetical protein